jgi:hypothetical protein
MDDGVGNNHWGQPEINELAQAEEHEPPIHSTNHPQSGFQPIAAWPMCVFLRFQRANSMRKAIESAECD